MQVTRTRGLIAALALAGIASATAASSPSRNAAVLGRRVDRSRQSIQLSLLGTYDPSLFGADAAEFIAHDPTSQRVFLVNNNLATDQQVDIIDVSNPAAPQAVSSIVYGFPGPRPNHVAVHHGVLAVGIEAERKDDPGSVEFYDAGGTFLSSVQVCPQPVHVDYTHDGTRLVVACEGEVGNVAGACVNPLGALAVIDLRGGVARVTMQDVSVHDFTEFDDDVLPGVRRLPTPTTPYSIALEPQSITIAHDDSAAFVTLQEANAMARFDLRRNRWDWVRSLGTKDWSTAGSGFDPSDQDGAAVLGQWPVVAFYQPDQVASFTHAGATFIVTPNEGELVEPPSPCPGLEDHRFGSNTHFPVAQFDTTVFSPAQITFLKNNGRLGRLKVAKLTMDTNGDGKYDQIQTYGGRSFSIWDSAGQLVWDSGSDFETLAASKDTPGGFRFNSNNDNNSSFDTRSDDKGPEPEGLVVGDVRGRRYAFINLERVGGIVVYDVSIPSAPVFVEYVNDRVWTVTANSTAAGPLGPKGMAFVPASESPVHEPLLLVANEVSGTMSIYRIGATP